MKFYAKFQVGQKTYCRTTDIIIMVMVFTVFMFIPNIHAFLINFSFNTFTSYDRLYYITIIYLA